MPTSVVYVCLYQADLISECQEVHTGQGQSRGMQGGSTAPAFTRQGCVKILVL